MTISLNIGFNHHRLSAADTLHVRFCVYWNATTLSYDDDIVTNNGDTEKILATIALIVLEFTEKFPTAFILAQGSTPSRTRKYQMAINKHHDEIMRLFDITGILPNNENQSFKRGVNYEAFLARRKF